MTKHQVEIIASKIRDDIQSGRLREFDPLPPRTALVEQFNSTFETVEKALHSLEIEGLIVKGRGRILRVSPRRARITTNDEVFRDVMAAQGYEVKTEHLKTPGIVPMSPSLAKLFHMPEGTPVIERLRREIINGIVYRYSRKTYLAELIPADHLEKMQADYTYNVRSILEEQRPLSRIEEIIIARAITEEQEARILNVAKGTPVLDQFKVNYDQQKRVSWVSQVVFNAQYFEKRFDYAPGEEPKSTNFLSSFLSGENYQQFP